MPYQKIRHSKYFDVDIVALVHKSMGTVYRAHEKDTQCNLDSVERERLQS